MANIIVRQQYNALGIVEARTFEWTVQLCDDEPQRLYADRHALMALFGRDKFRVGEVVGFGDLRVRVTAELDVARDAYPCERDGMHARWSALSAPISRILDLVYRRMVITAAVWRLAKYHEAAIPTWRDVYALDRSAKFWHKWVMLED